MCAHTRLNALLLIPTRRSILERLTAKASESERASREGGQVVLLHGMTGRRGRH